MRFTSVYLKNFGPYKEAELSLTGRGVRAIVAQRDDSAAFDSNGSGKSRLPYAVYWGLFGELPLKVPAHEVIRRGSKGGCVVSLGAVNEQDQVVTIVRSKGGGMRGKNKIAITVDGQDVTPKGRGEPEKLIESLLGTSRAAFGYSTFFGSSEVFRFSAATDSARKDILAKMLQFGMWEDGQVAAKEEAKALDDEIQHADAQATAFRTQLADIEGRIVTEGSRIAQEGQELLDRAQVTNQSLVIAQGAVSATDELHRKRDLADDLIQKIYDEINSFDLERDGLVREALRKTVEAQTEARAAVTAIRGLNNSTCPTCGQELDIEGRDEHLELHTQAEKDAKAKEAEAVEDGRVAEICHGENVEAPTAEKAKVEAMRAMIESELRKAQAASDKVQDLTEQLDVIARATDNLRAGLDQLEQQRETATKSIASFDSVVEEKTEAFNLAKFWVEGFGKKGIQAYLLDEVIPFLEERTNVYLITLSDGALIADFGTQAEGSKKTLEKLDISVLKDGFKAHVGTLSGGERRRFDLAVSFALHDLLTQRGVRSSCLFLDEVFDTLDETGSERVVEVIRQKQEFSGVESVFVISHSQRVVEAFPNRITVKHRDGVSWLEEN